MSANYQSVHHTEIYELHEQPGGTVIGWEFVCPQCSYQARYVAQTQRLEIINLGDPHARHTGNQLAAKPAPSREVRLMEISAEDEGMEYVPLPDHLEKQLMEILARVDNTW